MKTIYFEAQTGIIREEKSKLSNFHQFELPESARNAIEGEISKATVGAGGLEYSVEFLPLLNTWERMHARAIRTRK